VLWYEVRGLVAASYQAEEVCRRPQPLVCNKYPSLVCRIRNPERFGSEAAMNVVESPESVVTALKSMVVGE
jgi:hypothetical protein